MSQSPAEHFTAGDDEVGVLAEQVASVEEQEAAVAEFSDGQLTLLRSLRSAGTFPAQVIRELEVEAARTMGMDRSQLNSILVHVAGEQVAVQSPMC